MRSNGSKSRFTKVQLQKKKKVLESNIEGVCTEIEKTGTNFKFSKISIKNPNF
jgi:hypothetical protein